jgi:endonuclease-3
MVHLDETPIINMILRVLHQEYPESKCSLNFSNPFELLVGTILSAQTTDSQVNKILPRLLNAFPDADALSKATLDDVKSYIKSLGLYNNKAKSLVSMAKQLVSEFDSQVPNTMNLLTTLPGVGRKTANVVLGNALGVMDSGITVDTHVIRLSKRIGLTKNSTATKIEQDLMKIVPTNEWVDITHLFIDHGRKICGRKPKCDSCSISTWCVSQFNFPHFKGINS